ncbi:MAG: low specificity L-threonine aldolase [Pseudonocardiaceae bacterium]
MPVRSASSPIVSTHPPRNSTTVITVPLSHALIRSLDADCCDLGPENSSLHPDCGEGRPMINLYSDTQTRPVPEMREAMAAAEVGDEQRGEDPTVNALCARVAALLGKPAAVFLPSGTMCNAIGFRLHIRPGGDAVHLHPTSHPIVAEGGGPSALSGAVLAPVDGEGGMFTAGALEAALFPAGDRYQPRSRLVSVEQTTNPAGGRVWPLDQVRAVLDVAARHGLRAHLDGARLMNAVVASGIPAADWAHGFDTAWIDFTKGLGAPVGAVLAGSEELIEQAWRYKQMMGGALRQAGIVAAGCLWALDHHVDRLADDHRNARILAEGLAGLPGITLDPDTVDTNIVVFGLTGAPKFCRRLEDEQGVRMGALGPDLVRAVTHHDVGSTGVHHATAAVAALLDGS